MRNTSCIRILFAIGVLLLSLRLTTEAQVRITEVNLATNRVELTNFGSTSVNLGTWQWCRLFVYGAVGGTIAAGETRQFTVSMNGTASDLCLYRSSLFGSSADLEDFVQWGSGGNGRENIAVAKGIWTAGVFLALPGTGNSFHAKAQPPASGLRTTNWFAGLSQLGAYPVPAPVIQSVAIVGGEWRLTASSFYLPAAVKVDAGADLATFVQQSPVITSPVSGTLDIRFPAGAGMRQFVKLRAAP